VVVAAAQASLALRWALREKKCKAEEISGVWQGSLSQNCTWKQGPTVFPTTVLLFCREGGLGDSLSMSCGKMLEAAGEKALSRWVNGREPVILEIGERERAHRLPDTGRAGGRALDETGSEALGPARAWAVIWSKLGQGVKGQYGMQRTDVVLGLG
jgi:hypothetical protein